MPKRARRALPEDAGGASLAPNPRPSARGPGLPAPGSSARGPPALRTPFPLWAPGPRPPDSGAPHPSPRLSPTRSPALPAPFPLSASGSSGPQRRVSAPPPCPPLQLPAPGSSPPRYPGPGSSAVCTAHCPGSQSLDPGVPSALPRAPASRLSAPGLRHDPHPHLRPAPPRVPGQRPGVGWPRPRSHLAAGRVPALGLAWRLARPLPPPQSVQFWKSPKAQAASDLRCRRGTGRGAVWSGGVGAGLRGLEGAPRTAGPGAGLSSACTRFVSLHAGPERSPVPPRPHF